MIDRHDHNTLPLFDQLPLSLKPGIALPGQPAHLKRNLRTKPMTSVHDNYGTRFLSAGDLKGREWTGEIVETHDEVFTDNGVEKTKTVVEFKNFPKPLVLNQTNALSIAKILDEDDTDDWIGGRVIVHPDLVQFGGKIVDAIRIKAPAPEVKQAPKKAAKKARATEESQHDDDLDDGIPEMGV